MNARLRSALRSGLAGNLLFVLFGFICYIYYLTYERTSAFSKTLEVIAYTVEIAGFGALIYSDYMLATTVRMRNFMKIGYSIYIVLECAMMYFELNTMDLEFYQPYSLGLAIVHSIVSAAVCFSFLQLDPDRSKFEALIIVCVGVMLGGMLGAIMGIRIYFSIVANAIGFALLFAGIIYLLTREEMEIDCHGDKAKVVEYDSNTMFEELFEEKKPKAGKAEKKKTEKQEKAEKTETADTTEKTEKKKK